MSDLDDIYQALQTGLTAAENLRTFVERNRPEAVGITDGRIGTLKRGLAAYDRVSGSLVCRRPHVEVDGEPFEGCSCNVVKMPPCSWCESGGGS